MNKVGDALRSTLISPEVVLLLGAVAFTGYAPSLVSLVAGLVKSNIFIGSAVAGAPLTMLIWGWSQVWEMLNPREYGAILLRWPQYHMLKSRVTICLVWCAAGSAAGFIAVAMILMRLHPEVAVGLLVGGLLAACSATASLAMARITLRELLSGLT